MLNEEKIRLMTELALFEKKNETEMKSASGYFKSDFISRRMIRGFVCYTICAFLGAGIWIVFRMDALLSTIEIETLIALGKKGIFLYLAGLFLYLSVIRVVYGRRYDHAVRLNRLYYTKLKHLNKRYEYHSRSRELAREGKRV